jgi:hypothetical protein
MKKKIKKTKKTKKIKKTKKTKTKTKKTKAKKEILDPTIKEIVEREIEIDCPVRGKIKKKVKVKILKPVTIDTKQIIETKDYIDKIDDDDSPIYGGTESSED